MTEAGQIENACADAWPALTERRLGGWRLRAAGGFTGRANSALAVGDPGTGLASALETVCDFAHAQRIDPVVQTIKDGPLEPALREHDWRPYAEYAGGHEVAVLLGGIDSTTRDPRVRVLDAPTPGWWRLTVGGTEPTEAQRRVLTSGPAVGFGVAEVDGGTAGSVRGAVADGLLLVARLAVDPAFRRRGLATALMSGIGEWGAAQGATRCVLQVSVGNSGALDLYAGLGFREHHRYRYWVPWKDRAS
ncbi:GNAT family N-acetyltransferase [Prauserella cavernicola]|uniref:GNAT family N-acetyltransferase n=1 Tax=Prauserella cavernicola TaxID=2800127 RepID=A0A934R0J5_9PSEU|nr:GNAT family N-acetyltransferase [Prauserella cavernicola]MBK1788884.1 GNAT family N-acetyltransferase [Prauserella cavernicola]